MIDKKPLVIGVCGGSGSGKTTLIKRLQEEIAHLNPALFTMDNYYRPIESQMLDPNGIVNFDLPTALDEERLSNDLTRLYHGNAIEVKEYFFNTQPGKNVLITIDPSDLILVEGLFLYHYSDVFKLVDWSVYVDVDSKTQLDRRIYRDQSTRGYKHQEIMGNGGPQTAMRSQISNRPEMKEASKIPGPGNYDPKLRRGSPVWSIGKGDRTDH